MKTSILLFYLLGSLLVMGLEVAPAHAQVMRTWVSGTGNDTNVSSNCSRTAPCATFAVALSKTLPSGEIDVLDPGGFGTVTISQSVSIVNDGVGEAGILYSATSGITINAGASDVVILRGLFIDGSNNSANGILIQSAGRVSIQNCVVQESGSAGINIAPGVNPIEVKIQDTTVTSNGAGVLIQPIGGINAYVSLDRSRIDNNFGGGVKADGTNGQVYLAISDSSISHNASNGVNTVGVRKNIYVNLMRDVISQNGLAGIQANLTPSLILPSATYGIYVGSSMLFSNNTVTSLVNSGVVYSYGSNQLQGSLGSGFTTTINLM